MEGTEEEEEEEEEEEVGPDATTSSKVLARTPARGNAAKVIPYPCGFVGY